jgi:hypothetical protein
MAAPRGTDNVSAHQESCEVVCLPSNRRCVASGSGNANKHQPPHNKHEAAPSIYGAAVSHFVALQVWIWPWHIAHTHRQPHMAMISIFW